MRIQEQILKHLRSYPNNVLLVSIVFLGVAFTLTSRTPTVPPISDFAYYVDMANGLSAPDPFGRRILVPFLAGLLGGSPLAFHYMNIILVAGAAVLLYLRSDSGSRDSYQVCYSLAEHEQSQSKPGNQVRMA